MESVNEWVSNFSQDNINNGIAIRQFCPARIKELQEHHQNQSSTTEEEAALLFMELDDEAGGLCSFWTPPTYHSKSNIPDADYHYFARAPSHEEEEIVDTFFNAECFDNDNKNLVEAPVHHDHELAAFAPVHVHCHDHFQFQDLHYQDFSLTNHDDIFGDDHDLMLFEEGDHHELDLEEVMRNSSDIIDHCRELMVPPEEEGIRACTHRESEGDHELLQLVHLLLACAEAVGCRDTQLADSLLTQIWPSLSPFGGDSVLRVSYCFALGLKSRLSGLLHNLNANATSIIFPNANATSSSSISREDKLEAFRLLHQATPYISFGFMAANDAICQVAKGKDLLHIIDLGSIHLLQWPSLIRNLSSRAEGPPKLVRITGMIKDQDGFFALEANAKGVIDEASSLGINLEFQIKTRPLTPLLLTRENLDLRDGEVVFVNSIMHLHKFVKESRGSLKTILQAIKRLGPALVTIVEQDANHNGPFFLGRFLESLHYYSAIFDSLEVSFQRDSPQRMKIEKFHFAEEIRNIIAYEGSDRIERHERADQWRRQLGRAGFQSVGLKSMSQVRMMLSVYGCDGYTLATDKGCLLLGWKGRPIMLASAWQVHNVTSS